MSKKWLVISNCQTVGLANSLSLFCPQADVDACDIWKFSAESEVWAKKIPEYDELIISPEIQSLGKFDFSSLPNVSWVPGFNFRGFHPDLCYVIDGQKLVPGPIGDYHSVFALAAFKSDLPLSAALQLFKAESYERAGFFAIWETEKKNLHESFLKNGWDISSDFVAWVRRDSFMHSTNHPRIDAIYDVARKVAVKLCSRVAESGIKPHDNLLAGPIFPVYPEIAEFYGISRGQYYYKPLGEYKVMSLQEFLARSYGIYERRDRAILNTDSVHYDMSMAVCREVM